MTVPQISLRELRELPATSFVVRADMTAAPGDRSFAHVVVISGEALLALVEAVEAAHRVDVAFDSRVPAVALIGCSLEMKAALARFKDYGEPA